MKIAIINDWRGTTMARQWPTVAPSEFRDIEFQFGSVEGADFVVVLNRPPADTWVECSPDKIWALIQEPPTPYHMMLHDGQPAFGRIYTTDSHYKDHRHIPFFGALEWHVKKSYDELVATSFPAKTGVVSWITSNATHLRGQRIRMNFLRDLQRTSLPLALFGRGFQPIDDKWDGMAPFRYSIAFENFADDLYWSEKLTDCFLSYATPFYFGTDTISRYFPPGSYIAIDPDDPHVFRKMQDSIEDGFHEANIEALKEARDLCLNKYNTLFFVAREALGYRSVSPPTKRRILLRSLPAKPPIWVRWKIQFVQALRRHKKLKPHLRDAGV